MNQKRQNLTTIVLLTGLPALLIRFGIVWETGFDGLYGQDAYYYFEQGRGIALSLEHRGQDSIGYPALLALMITAFGVRPEIAQLVGLTMGSLTPVLVSLLGWVLTKRLAVALISGLLVGLLPYHIRSSIVIMSDVPALFWLTGGVLCGIRYLQHPTWKCGLASVVLFTLATITRYISALAFLPVLAYAVVSGRRPPWRHIVAGSAVGLLIALPELQHMELHIPSLFIAQAWHPLNALRSEFVTPDGLLSYPWPVALMDIRTLGGWSFLNPIWAACSLIGLWVLRKDPPLLAFTGIWLLGLFGFLAGLPLVNPRYLMPLTVPLSLCCAVGLVFVHDHIDRKATAIRVGVGVTLLAGLLGLTMGSSRTIGEVIDRKACEMEAVAWIEHNIPVEGSLIIAFDMAHAAQRYTHHRVVHLHEIDADTLAVPTGDTPGLYLIWNEAHAGRIAKRHPGTDDVIPRFAGNYSWLRDRMRHTTLANICDWEVIKLNTP